MANHRFQRLWAAPLLMLALVCCAEPSASPGGKPAGSPGDGASDATLAVPDSGTTSIVGVEEPPVSPTPDPQGGQTGDDNGLQAAPCEPVATHARGFDEPSTLGFAPSEVLPLGLGSFRVPMSWLEPVFGSDEQVLDYRPRASSDVQLHIELLGSEARVIEYGGCIDDVEVDVRVRLSSADGALGEEFDSYLLLRQGHAALRVPVQAPTIQGNPAFEPATLRGMPPTELELSASFTRYGIAGQLVQWYGAGNTRRAARVAEWPIWGDCFSLGVTPALDEGQNPSVEGLLATVRGTKPMTLIGADGVALPPSSTSRPGRRRRVSHQLRYTRLHPSRTCSTY